MPSFSDFSINRGVDTVITIEMTPPVAMGGWDVSFQAQRYFGSASGFYRASMNSGYFGSGIVIVNSGDGIVNVTIPASATSGLDAGAYTYQLRRNNSGLNTVLSQGYMRVSP